MRLQLQGAAMAGDPTPSPFLHDVPGQKHSPGARNTTETLQQHAGQRHAGPLLGGLLPRTLNRHGVDGRHVRRGDFANRDRTLIPRCNLFWQACIKIRWRANNGFIRLAKCRNDRHAPAVCAALSCDRARRIACRGDVPIRWSVNFQSERLGRYSNVAKRAPAPILRTWPARETPTRRTSSCRPNAINHGMASCIGDLPSEN